MSLFGLLRYHRNRVPQAVWLACLLPLIGCASQVQQGLSSIRSAWKAKDTAGSRAPADRVHSAAGPANRVAEDTPDGTPIATVDGRPIARVSVVNLLLEAHGVGVLEQLIALHAAEALAAKKELTVTAADVDFEYDLALRRLSDPLSSVTPATFDRRDAERLLDSVLAERNLSRGEFLLTLRRNAYLRRIVDAELTFTDEQLEAESNQAFGERVQIRHIQLGSAMDVARIQERIAAGEEFGELAVRYSANTGSARQRGLLDPFSAGDERLPALLRQVAFSLKPAEVSNVVRIGEWHHLLKLERRLAAEPRDLAASRGELEGRLRQREAEKAMRELYEKLLRETAVEIHDPILRGAFERKYPRRVP